MIRSRRLVRRWSALHAQHARSGRVAKIRHSVVQHAVDHFSILANKSLIEHRKPAAYGFD